MPKAYLDAIDNFPIGEDSLAFGLAVPTGHPVITPDVFEEQLWKPWTYIAEKYDYRGCWSFPIKTRDDKAIGTFAMYFQTKREATDKDLALADIVTRAAAVIISNYNDNLDRATAEAALRRSEEKLRELNLRLQENDKAKTSFFNNVSHEFRTPLTLILGPLEELIKSEKTSMAASDMQMLQFAYRSARRLQKLVTTLLDFARIEAVKQPSEFQPMDFSKTTIELAGNFRSAIETAGLKFMVTAEQISEPVYLNLEMWEKVVFNLLSNAFKIHSQRKNRNYHSRE